MSILYKYRNPTKGYTPLCESQSNKRPVFRDRKTENPKPQNRTMVFNQTASKVIVCSFHVYRVLRNNIRTIGDADNILSWRIIYYNIDNEKLRGNLGDVCIFWIVYFLFENVIIGYVVNMVLKIEYFRYQ